MTDLEKERRATKNTGPDGEVQGTCRWVSRPDASGRGVLHIIDGEYPVAPVSFSRRFIGFVVGDYEIWWMEPDAPMECDCGDWVYRRQGSEKGCKHTAALAAALAKIGWKHPNRQGGK